MTPCEPPKNQPEAYSHPCFRVAQLPALLERTVRGVPAAQASRDLAATLAQEACKDPRVSARNRISCVCGSVCLCVCVLHSGNFFFSQKKTWGDFRVADVFFFCAGPTGKEGPQVCSTLRLFVPLHASHHKRTISSDACALRWKRPAYDCQYVGLRAVILSVTVPRMRETSTDRFVSNCREFREGRGLALGASRSSLLSKHQHLW
jgi:hypothetical protein